MLGARLYIGTCDFDKSQGPRRGKIYLDPKAGRSEALVEVEVLVVAPVVAGVGGLVAGLAVAPVEELAVVLAAVLAGEWQVVVEEGYHLPAFLL